MQRLLVHFWSKYGRPKDSKSVSSNRSSGKTHNDTKTDVEEPQEKDSTSSGLINFSSTTGSSTSDNQLVYAEQVGDELEEHKEGTSLRERTRGSSAQTANIPEVDVCASIRSELSVNSDTRSFTFQRTPVVSHHHMCHDSYHESRYSRQISSKIKNDHGGN
ncbi:hypothetical protein AHF37_11933 [Paragonimus kellicotti]|nr:hypothetical protein AHF37_11933 [Paragonimus kellicotti]